jgi:molybdate transport system substrate-binding protein
MRESLEAVGRQFETAHGHKVVVSYAASSALAKQIENGAPADIFVSADLDWVDYVEQRKLAAPGSRINLLTNTLVLIAPSDSKTDLRIAPNFPLGSALAGGRLSMANPEVVPAGKYGKAALQTLGVWSAVQAGVVRAENVRAALAYVSRGEAPFGIVYRTDALADRGVRVVDSFPPGSHPPIVYPAILVAGLPPERSAAAKNLLLFMKTPEAGATWRRYGFSLAEK